jgi:hypothetical protein
LQGVGNQILENLQKVCGGLESSRIAYENAVANLGAVIAEARARIVRGELPEVLSNPMISVNCMIVFSESERHGGST